MAKYKVGDKVRVVAVLHGGCSHEFKIGSVVTVDYVDKEDDDLCYRCVDEKGDDWWVSDSEIEPADAVVAQLSVSLDEPTAAMKEFADHCERAASALERIKAALA